MGWAMAGVDDRKRRTGPGAPCRVRCHHSCCRCRCGCPAPPAAGTAACSCAWTGMRVSWRHMTSTHGATLWWMPAPHLRPCSPPWTSSRWVAGRVGGWAGEWLGGHTHTTLQLLLAGAHGRTSSAAAAHPAPVTPSQIAPPPPEHAPAFPLRLSPGPPPAGQRRVRRQEAARQAGAPVDAG